MLHPKVIQKTIRQVNMDRNLNLSDVTISILSDAINNSFRYADSPAKNIEKITGKIKELRDEANTLSRHREQFKEDCEHVWLRQLQPDLPFFCNACGTEVPL